jgi:hypothetical protein
MWRVFRRQLRSFSDHLSPASHHKFTIKKPRSATTFSQKPLQKHPFTTVRKNGYAATGTGTAARIRIGWRFQYVSDRHTHSIGPNSKYRSQIELNAILKIHIPATA